MKGKKVLITGSSGFIGKNLIEGLKRCQDLEIKMFDKEDTVDGLEGHLKAADIIFHLAGVNRPENPKEFETGNIGLTQTILDILDGLGRSVPIVFSSSTQATLDNPYGLSKKKAEDYLDLVSKLVNMTDDLFRGHIYKITNSYPWEL